ncbi:MAG: chemotaxis protein CheW [Rhodospirillaceae bacterium]|nr:chemotaxis protein CheW [Rhodospirillaceae bacterium]
MTSLPAVSGQSASGLPVLGPGAEKFLTFRVGGQLFGIPALAIQDIIGPQPIAKIPMAPSFVAGALNLRGRIVTAIDMHNALGLKPTDQAKKLNVVVRSGLELYDLLVDDVGDVLSFSMGDLEPNPVSWPEAWRTFSAGIFKLDGELLVVLNFDVLLSTHTKLIDKAA